MVEWGGLGGFIAHAHSPSLAPALRAQVRVLGSLRPTMIHHTEKTLRRRQPRGFQYITYCFAI